MGACDFSIIRKGATARAAFDEARDEARAHDRAREDQSGEPLAGYTGSISVKPSFTMIPLPGGIDRTDTMACHDAAHALLMAEDPRVDDKWGPAGCFDLGGGEWMFFGWAPE